MNTNLMRTQIKSNNSLVSNKYSKQGYIVGFVPFATKEQAMKKLAMAPLQRRKDFKLINELVDPVTGRKVWTFLERKRSK